MTAQALDSPVVTGDALRSVNFFNGRLLTGDDLRSEQSTSGSRLARLGRAAGEGVAYGLEVKETIGTSTKAKPVVTVAAGLALARSGQALELSATVDVALARSQPVAGSEPDGLFADCQPFTTGTYTAGAGVYLLAIGPARQGEGRAQVSGLSNEPAPCNVATSVEAVRFRLIRLAVSSTDLADKSHLRNRVAYACFGADALANYWTDPFGASEARGGLVDALREETLGDEEVPLAVLGWTSGDGIQFVDQWSVRRRIMRREHEAGWSSVAAERRHAVGEAMFLQFQDEIDDLRGTPGSQDVRVHDHFGSLPPVGLLPLATTSQPRGFDGARFFKGMTVRNRESVVDGVLLERLVRDSFDYSAIDPAAGELVWRYTVRQNALSADTVQPYIAFATGFMPYIGDARFDLARFDYSTHSLLPG